MTDTRDRFGQLTQDGLQHLLREIIGLNQAIDFTEKMVEFQGETDDMNCWECRSILRKLKGEE